MSILINAALSGGLLLAALSIKLQIGLMSLCNRFLKNDKARAVVDRGNIQIRHPNDKTYLCRLDKARSFRVEECAFRERDNPDPAIQLHDRKKFQ